MAEPWEVEVGGQVYEVEADTPQQAAVLARLMAAREQGVAQAEAGAMERSEAAPAAANENLSPTELLARTKMAQAKNVPAGAIPAALGLVTLPGLISSAIAAPGATAASLGAGYLGSEVGERGGRKLEEYGAPGGTSKALGLAGGLAGGIYGGIKGQAILKDLLKTGVGRGSMLGQILERVAGTEAGAGAVAAKETTEEAAARIAKIQAETERIAARKAQDAERHELQKQILQRRLEGKAPLRSRPATTATVAKPPTSAEPEMLPEEAVSVVAEPLPETAAILPKGQRTMATISGGKARPSPPATPPEELEAALTKTLEALKARKAGVESPLRGPRLEVGAQRVGRDVGLTKEQVRLQTGPRIDEALGEASPVLPDVPLQKIIDTMKALPKTGGAREAYVARATSGKTKWQVENVRRTLEHLGLLVPAGAAGGALLGRRRGPASES